MGRPMSRHNKDKGRLPDFIPVIKSTWRTPAWQAMSHGARLLHIALRARYNMRLQNAVYLSARIGAEELGSSKDYIARWHHELQHYGFTVVVSDAHLGVEGHGKAAHVRLTEAWYAGKPPTRDFERWDGTKFRYTKKKQKQKPVPQTGDTLSRKLGTVASRKVGTVSKASVLQTGDIREAPQTVLQTGDITSLTTPLSACSAEKTARLPWGAPTLEPMILSESSRET